MSDPIVGIDLGTSNTVVAHADGMGNIKVLADESGYKIHPSVVSFHPNGGVIVGAPAKQRKVIDPANTIYSVKRLIGRAYSSPEVKTAQKRMPFQIKAGENELPLIVTRAGEFAVPEISAIVLDHVKHLATAQLGAPVTRAVVTVPASFNDAQRSATATAGAIAGLTVVRVLNEPTAAALAYGNTRNLHQTIAVYDFGGGTFDITILKLNDQVYEVLGTAGDTFLGGDDLDERLVDKMVSKFLAENRVDLRSNEVSMMRLRAVAEQTKIELSRRSRAVVRVDEIAYGAKGKPLNLQIEITRDEFVSQVADIIDKTFPVCKEALSYANLGIDKIDDVILVGGTTKIPYVRDQVSKYFAKAPRTDVNPEDAVAVGAALQATSLERILKRSVSQKVSMPRGAPVVSVPEDTQTSSLDTSDDLLDAPTVDSTMSALLLDDDDEPNIATNVAAAPTAEAPNAKPRPDTEYSLPRTGTRDAVFEERTPVPAVGAIGRLRPAPRKGDQAKPPPRPQTPRGVPAAPPRTSDAPIVDVPDWGAADDFQTKPGAEQPGANLSATTLLDMDPAVLAPPVPDKNLTTLVEPLEELAPPSMERAYTSARALPQSVVPPHQMPTQAVHLPAPPAPQAPVFAAPLPFAGPQPLPFAGPQPLPFSEPVPMNAPKMAMPVVMDVTPRGLGIATVAGFCEELIRRNSRLPAELKKVFSTSRDQQTAVTIVVCQGESRRLDNNTIIGDLRLEGIPPRPRGETSIEVTFSLDASGILRVRARDALTGREQQASLDLVGGLGAQDVAASRDRIQQLRR